MIIIIIIIVSTAATTNTILIVIITILVRAITNTITITVQGGIARREEKQAAALASAQEALEDLAATLSPFRPTLRDG